MPAKKLLRSSMSGTTANLPAQLIATLSIGTRK